MKKKHYNFIKIIKSRKQNKHVPLVILNRCNCSHLDTDHGFDNIYHVIINKIHFDYEKSKCQKCECLKFETVTVFIERLIKSIKEQ